MKALKTLTLAGLLVGLTGITQAQDDLGKQLSKVAGQNAVNYVSPLLSSLGADLNSGFYHSADLHDILGFDIGLKLGATIVKDEEKVFNFVMPDKVTYSGITFSAGVDYDKTISNSPTALGVESGVPVKVKAGRPGAGQTIFTTPQGFNFKYVPLVAPQAAIGLPLGLEVIGRFIPTVTLPEEAGKINFIGFGLRHDIDQYIPLFPLQVSVHFVTQNLTLTDNADKKILSGSATAYGVEVSKNFALLTLYGGFQLEKSKWDIESYSFSDPSSAASIQVQGFSVEGKNTSRFHAGVRLLLLVLNVHADYSFATHPVVTAGVGISFR
ncbi:MAG TPA: hypothetical protein DCP63_06140 [Bacteroidetes bacterium]|nr:hypothetical protein [Bacteroidota bacterium]